MTDDQSTAAHTKRIIEVNGQDQGAQLFLVGDRTQRGRQGLGLLVFCSPTSTHQGETREQRITEFHALNDPPVVGLREGAWLRVEGSAVYLGGSNGARLFRQGKEPVEYAVGSRIDFLMG